MKYLFSLFITISVSFLGNSQNLNLDNPLPVDSSIIKGVLPNGMTYYIKSTDVVKGASSYYIIQNVGSILENDNQQGLAHFLEHMAFNGTQNFPGKRMLNTLQAHGAVFGKDINAYTSFDETVYNLTNIPNEDGMVDTCLTILNDWSNYLLLSDEEIDAERGVIKEEWRTGQSGQKRLYESSMPVKFNNSKYVNRLPIGLMSVVEGFDYKDLRDFYHDWYRTDLQAIAVIGDFDVNEIELKIKNKFSKIPAVKNSKERYYVNIPEHEKLLYSFGTDPEVSRSSISLGIRHKKTLKPETIADFKQSLLESLAVNMLSSRISEQVQDPNASFLSASTGYSTMVRTSKVFSMSVYPKPNQQQQAFKDVLIEVNRAVKFGYNQSEIDRNINLFKTSYENQISMWATRSHKSIEGTIQSNFLNNSTMTDINKEYELAKVLLNQITAQEIHNTIKRLYSKSNRFINVIGVDGQNNLTETEAIQIIKEVENDSNLTPYTEVLDKKTIVSSLKIVPGKIASVEVDKEVEATTYVLSNNVKVHYKFANKQKNIVSLSAVSYGGKTLINDEDLASASVITSLVSNSGVTDFSAIELKKFLAGKTASVNLNIGEFTETVIGGSNTKDVETMLQLVHAYFVKPRFDENAYQVLENNIENYLVSRGKDVEEKIKDSITYTLYGENNPKRHILNKAYAEAISLENIESIYNERFENVSDFEFFIVGDISETQLKPLLETFLASIPSKNIKENFIASNQPEWISETIDKEIYLEMEDPKASVNMAYMLEMPYSIKNAVVTQVLGDLLQLRVTETVRESEGGAYSPRASASFSREPKPEANVSFNFDCNPEMADKLVNVVKQEFLKISEGTIKQNELGKIKANYFRERAQAKDNNGYYMRKIIRYYRYNENMDDPDNFENLINSIKEQDIQHLANQILNESKTYEIIIKPKH
ncbi:peptidase, M16 family [Formosa agariphila KMM 3901]|uniref:Peptidase, M16 family n=1 Tax=Formosa agariphila (strain DSM 15362 / KCTC 12365 / LMG 23005 / KMM 3901 / M-2Alg 35-1) TaxID=1347342 RepID=T2KNY9_FORAG|nr:M16 family metallopeptidase [Formosa agariphila]CDF80178.1 peptidase, M16 family [Formosa agariphila KMM 3901]